MDEKNYLITDEEIEKNGVCSAPDYIKADPADIKGVFDKLPKLIAGKLNGFIEAVVAKFLDYYTKDETIAAINSKMTEMSSGDMAMYIYDTNKDGTVDNADRLGGQLPEYYATKAEVETAAGNVIKKAGDTMTGRLTLSADPTSKLHAATKQYVDNKTGKVLIWSNADPASSFKGQEVAPSDYERDDYAFFIVRFRFSTSNQGNVTIVVLPTGVASRVNMFSDLTAGSAPPCIHERTVNFTSDNKITFSDAYKNYTDSTEDTDSTSSAVDNTYLIPTHIYGFKL